MEAEAEAEAGFEFGLEAEAVKRIVCYLEAEAVGKVAASASLFITHFFCDSASSPRRLHQMAVYSALS